MKTYRLKAWTGPTQVTAIAEKLKTVPAFSFIVDGTENVYWEYQADDSVSAVQGSLGEMKRYLDTTFGLSPYVMHEVTA